MKRRELEAHLRKHGCFLHQHGGSHDVWMNPTNEQQAPVPRHHEVKNGTAQGVCRILKIPKPPGL